MGNKYLLDTMLDIRIFSSLFHNLRNRLGIPLQQPLLDFSFGYNNDLKYIEKEYIQLLCKEINIYNLGYTFSNRNFYRGFEIVKPDEDNWEILEENNRWVSLYIIIPNWLKGVYNQRKEYRKEAIRRKKLGLPYDKNNFN